MTRFLPRLSRAALAAALFVACSGDDDPVQPPPDNPAARVASIEVTGTPSVEVGSGTHWVAVLRDSAGEVVDDVPVRWRSADTALVSIDSMGYLLAKRIATVRITAEVTTPRGVLSDTQSLATRLWPYFFAFDDTVPPAERRLLYDAVQDAHAFHQQLFEGVLDDSVVISGVYAAPGCGPGGAAAFAGDRSVTFCLGNPGWRSHGPGIRRKIAHHELFHLWQFAYWGDPAKSPAWLLEGAAEMMGYYGIASRGVLSYDTALGCQLKEAADFAQRQPPGLPSLQSVETREAFQGTQGPLYTHAMLAAEYLMDSGDGLAALETYGALLRGGASWQAAFEQAFQVGPAAFYAGFPGHLAGMTVPATYACGI